ncbi:hypothetical protein Tco_0141434 [Tanacetum coccineum]
MSVVTTAMTAILKQFQATPPPASVKAVEEICFTCGGPHPYYQCLAADGNTFPEYRDNIQGYVAAAAGNYNQGNAGYRPPGVVNQTRPLVGYRDLGKLVICLKVYLRPNVKQCMFLTHFVASSTLDSVLVFYSADNLTDSFTKALAFLKHSELTRNIRMLPASSLM